MLRQSAIATSMIDISDGLSTDLAHLCEESGTGAEIWAEAIPRARRKGKAVSLELALDGGDDYELLFTAAQQTRVPSRMAGTRISCVGRMVDGSRLLISQADGLRSPLPSAGWEHFRRLPR
jgi:thiamine-monophosphate kinase